MAVAEPDIWKGDLFDRKTEANQLEAYIESLVGRPDRRGDRRAYTIAVEAPYGQGKTFFLRRFAQQMAKNHPVAFVDAWADDLADEPLTALAATLDQALSPFLENPEVRSKREAFLRTTGLVLKLGSIGLLKRGLGLAIGVGTVDLIADAVEDTSNEVEKAINKGVVDAAQGLIEDSTKAITSTAPGELMQSKIEQFNEGKQAIDAMKASLAGLVQALEGSAHHAPIVIVIDELDRCRPTYAIKLLEEIKHLFDVPGLCFVLGMHVGQLQHSVSGAYGGGFDGRAYLRRFIDREYMLAEPELSDFLEYLCAERGVDKSVLHFPALVENSMSLGGILADYARCFELSARDALQLTDIFQTCFAVAKCRLWAGYLVPLIMARITSLHTDQINQRLKFSSLVFEIAGPKEGVRTYTPEALFIKSRQYANEKEEDAIQSWNRRKFIEGIHREIIELFPPNSDLDPICSPKHYPELIRTVSRFKSPSPVGDEAEPRTDTPSSLRN